jgi:hypothetical protein
VTLQDDASILIGKSYEAETLARGYYCIYLLLYEKSGFPLQNYGLEAASKIVALNMPHTARPSKSLTFEPYVA